MKLLLLGLGTVGSGVVDVLEMNKSKIEQMVGEKVSVTHAYIKNIEKTRNINTNTIKLLDDIESVKNLEVDLVVEVMGGIQDTKEIVASFLKRGIPVVSANKDMLAVYIDELEALAHEKNTHLKYEAAVAGSIPIIRTIATSFNSNAISRVMGILNGTTNFILSSIENEGVSYEEALAEATRLGYAEQDPTNDVDGIDASRKILLLARLAFDKKLKLDDVELKGIRDIESKDIFNLKNKGYSVKLIGDAKFDGEEISISVEPKAFKKTHMLANVDGSMNGVFLSGNAFDEAFLYGPGAGSLETASAVVSDIINAFTEEPNIKVPTETAVIDKRDTYSTYYVRTHDDVVKIVETSLHELKNDKNVSVFFEMIGD